MRFVSVYSVSASAVSVRFESGLIHTYFDYSIQAIEREMKRQGYAIR